MKTKLLVASAVEIVLLFALALFVQEGILMTGFAVQPVAQEVVSSSSSCTTFFCTFDQFVKEQVLLVIIVWFVLFMVLLFLFLSRKKKTDIVQPSSPSGGSDVPSAVNSLEETGIPPSPQSTVPLSERIMEKKKAEKNDADETIKTLQSINDELHQLFQKL